MTVGWPALRYEDWNETATRCTPPQVETDTEPRSGPAMFRDGS